MLLLLVLGSANLHAATPADNNDASSAARALETEAKPFFKQFCIRCHSADKMTSGVRLDQLNAAVEDRQLRLWQAVRDQLADGAMPPEDEPQPSAVQRQRMIGWIGQALHEAQSRPQPKNGLVRRLTVSQYRNTLRELLKLEDDFSDRLPPDAVSRDGFVNNKDTLQLSPLLLEAYFEIAEAALDRAIVDSAAKPTIQNVRIELGRAINRRPCPDELILGAMSRLLANEDFIVTQPMLTKPFEFDPLAMRTRWRFIEGYKGNATVRGWREYDSIYHAVFACMRGSPGYPKGEASSAVPEGLLLRPAIPADTHTYGPKANFKISLRELPEEGPFRITVTAARYDDGLLLDPGARPRPADAPAAVVCRNPQAEQSVVIEQAGIYQVDVHAAPLARAKPDGLRLGEGLIGPRPMNGTAATPRDLRLTLGKREFAGTLRQPAFLVVRLPAGALPVSVQYRGPTELERLVFTQLEPDDELARQFEKFERRSPQLGVHLGLRRDCGSTLARVGQPQSVSGGKLSRFVFTGTRRNFPSPEVEKDNVNYLAGIHEIGVRSEYTDGREMPRLLIRSVEFEGPCYESWPPEPHRNIFVDFDHKDDLHAYGGEIIHRFATRAFRREIMPAEQSSLIEVFEESMAKGAPFQQSVKNALLVVLTSPQFLFLIENSSSPAAEPLDGYELASKLSYFLWNGPPDRRLLDLAAAGKLQVSLNSEVDRLLADSRFSRFVDEFASQWLQLSKFDVLEPDRDQFPKLIRDTRAQLRREPIEFLAYLIHNNLPASTLIESDMIVANDTVAGYYDLGASVEAGFGFVPVKHGRPELGGVLSQAAILAGLSDGRESNPVKRGAWIARRIIAQPPDDPPPNVPALEKEDGKLTLRQRLEQHRNQNGCVQCHTKIDPWGLPLEEFDAGGRLKPQPVDARSTLPDKTHLAGAGELKRYLAHNRIDQVAFSVLKHLAVYATGRTLSYAELEDLRQSALELKPDGYRLQDIIRLVVNSRSFLEK